LTTNNNNVFIVHGQDEAMKLSVARTIEKLGLNATVLHEKPNQGKTIIEKFTEYSDVGFAIVLLSPDDISLSTDTAVEKRSFRARQNVIFERGFFIGKLGRNRVVSLFRQADGFELPSDYSGVLFVPFDNYNHWRFDLIRELGASGYKVDANKLLE
jgi:predicted nucleotide-binding protein